MNKRDPEAVVRRFSVRRRFLEILQNSQENTCTGDVLRLYHNLLEQFPHISKANFAILFSSENIKTKNSSFLKNRSRHWRCSIKKVFLKISHNLQKNTCLRVSFSINFIKNFLRQGNQVFAYHDYIFSSLDIMNYLYVK